MDLQAELEIIAASAPESVLGFAVTDLRNDQIVAALNPNRPFQLASMFKVPVLVAALRAVDEGKLQLAARSVLDDGDKLIGSGVLSYLDAGLQPTLRDLLTLMIIQSDNTATDIVLRLLGGPPAVERALRDLGVSGLHVRHTTRDLLWAVFPADALVLTEAEFAQYTRVHRLERLDHLVAPDAATNVGSPRALTHLLAKLARGECASPASTDLMLTILQRQTYNQRLPRYWPLETVFAHKTGTLSVMRGDCGILYWKDQPKVVLSGIVEMDVTSLPLTPAQEEAGDSLLAQAGKAVYAWAEETLS